VRYLVKKVPIQGRGLYATTKEQDAPLFQYCYQLTQLFQHNHPQHGINDLQPLCLTSWILSDIE